MASFYTKDQLDVLAQVVGNRIKNSVTDIRIANELEKSSEHKLITKSYKQSIDALISGSTADPEKNYTAAENIISFIDALDNGYVAITPEIPSDTEEPLEIEVGPNTTEGEETFRFRSRVSPDYVDPNTEAGVFLSLSVQPEGVWEVKDPITNEIIANSEGVLLPHVDLSPITPDSPVDLVFYHKTEAEFNFSVSGDIDSLTLGSLEGIGLNNPEEEVYDLNSPSDPEVSPGIIEVQAFSKHISSYTFSVDWNLKVPRSLPKHITSLAGMFQQTRRFNQDISTWNTINITDMSNMFYSAAAFNSPLNDWNTSNVTTMESMFSSAENFNQHIYKWDVSKVESFNSMFSEARKFNQDISGWDVSNVTSMNSTFSNCVEFDQPIGSWNIGKVGTSSELPGAYAMESIFDNAVKFSQDLSQWCTAYIEYMPNNFGGNLRNDQYPVWGTCPRNEVPVPIKYFEFQTDSTDTVFRGELILKLTVPPETTWTLVKINPETEEESILSTSVENSTGIIPIGGSSETYNSYRFEGEASKLIMEFEHNIVDGHNQRGSVNVTHMSDYIASYEFKLNILDLWMPAKLPKCVTSTSNMFAGINKFNSNPIGDWDVSNVTDMSYMFYECNEFTGGGMYSSMPSWDVSKVTNMEGMFSHAYKFKLNLSSWCVSNITTEPTDFALNAPLLTENKKPIWGTCPYRTPEEFWNLNENPRVLLNSSSNLTPSNLNCNFKFQINGDVYNEDLSLDITDTGPWSDRVSVFRDETTGLLGFSANQSEWLDIILTIPENMRQYYNQFDLGTGIIAEDGRIYFIIYAT